jgi:F-type H+-transporting ATPase subunit delta
MIHGSLARRYARALLTIGRGEGTSDALVLELDRFAKLMQEDRMLHEVLIGPTVPRPQRDAVLSQVARRMNLSPTLVRFLRLLNDRRRLEYLPRILLSFREMLDEVQGRVRATVTTAAALSAAAEAEIKATLSKLTGKEVVMTVEVHPELIGGVVTRVSGLLLDGSIKTQLRQIREELARVE